MRKKVSQKSINRQVIWIIGASSGIGEALAKYYAGQGAKLILSARRRDKLYNVKASIKANPMNIHVLPLDLENTEDLVLQAKEALRIFGRIDVLIHSAGVTQRGLAVETTLPVAKSIMNINYWGPVALTKTVLPAMIRNGGGHIVVMSSLMGKFSTRMRSSYAASKHALHGYFEALRAEVYDDDIRISMVCPGFVRTTLAEKALKADGETYNKQDEAHAKAMPVDVFIKKLIPRLKKQKEEIIIGGPETKALWANRFFPAYLRKKLRV